MDLKDKKRKKLIELYINGLINKKEYDYLIAKLDDGNDEKGSGLITPPRLY